MASESSAEPRHARNVQENVGELADSLASSRELLSSTRTPDSSMSGVERSVELQSTLHRARGLSELQPEGFTEPRRDLY
eukprot:15472099-Alexandrium_andersonii.AAC.1